MSLPHKEAYANQSVFLQKTEEKRRWGTKKGKQINHKKKEEKDEEKLYAKTELAVQEKKKEAREKKR